MMNSDYKRKRDELLNGVYRIGFNDSTLEAYDWKKLRPGVQEAFDALLLETVDAVIGPDEDRTKTMRIGDLHDLITRNEFRAEARQKAKELINPVEETE